MWKKIFQGRVVLFRVPVIHAPFWDGPFYIQYLNFSLYRKFIKWRNTMPLQAFAWANGLESVYFIPFIFPSHNPVLSVRNFIALNSQSRRKFSNSSEEFIHFSAWLPLLFNWMWKNSFFKPCHATQQNV